MVYGLGFRSYNTSINSFNKHLKKGYKTLFKILENVEGLSFKML